MVIGKIIYIHFNKFKTIWHVLVFDLSCTAHAAVSHSVGLISKRHETVLRYSCSENSLVMRQTIQFLFSYPKLQGTRFLSTQYLNKNSFRTGRFTSCLIIFTEPVS